MGKQSQSREKDWLWQIPWLFSNRAKFRPITFNRTLFHLRDGHDISAALPQLLNGNLPRIQSALCAGGSFSTRWRWDYMLMRRLSTNEPVYISTTLFVIKHSWSAVTWLFLRLCVLFLLFTLPYRRWPQSRSAARGLVWAINCALHVD